MVKKYQCFDCGTNQGEDELVQVGYPGPQGEFRTFVKCGSCGSKNVALVRR